MLKIYWKFPSANVLHVKGPNPLRSTLHPKNILAMWEKKKKPTSKDRGRKEKGMGKGKGEGKSAAGSIPDTNCTAADVCVACKWQYGSKNDPQSDVDWCMCISCQAWYHLSCAEVNGILDDDDYFTCEKCL